MRKFQSTLDNIYNTYIEYNGKTYYVRSDEDYRIFVEFCKKESTKNETMVLFGSPKLLEKIRKDLNISSSKLEERELRI